MESHPLRVNHGKYPPNDSALSRVRICMCLLIDLRSALVDFGLLAGGTAVRLFDLVETYEIIVPSEYHTRIPN
jgi:hypothetical protein